VEHEVIATKPTDLDDLRPQRSETPRAEEEAKAKAINKHKEETQ